MIRSAEHGELGISSAANGALAEILPSIRRLGAYDKLVLIRILADDLAREINNLVSIPPGVYEFYTPYEIEGITQEMIDRFEALPHPAISEDEN
ncbi:MAG: hypothetical protein RMJ60_04345 [Anaerolineales bacterium]|nr:hypothetical protein [Anaerolineales bacterium]